MNEVALASLSVVSCGLVVLVALLGSVVIHQSKRIDDLQRDKQLLNELLDKQQRNPRILTNEQEQFVKEAFERGDRFVAIPQRFDGVGYTRTVHTVQDGSQS